jgi:hypothetical protein
MIDRNSTPPPEMYRPELGLMGWVETFQPQHRASHGRPVRSFRYAGRIFSPEQNWKGADRAPKHRAW